MRKSLLREAPKLILEVLNTFRQLSKIIENSTHRAITMSKDAKM